MECKQCKTEFESKRKDALFCSDKCRKADKRADKPEIMSDKKEIKADKMSEIIPKVSDINVRDNKPVSEIIETEQQKRYRAILAKAPKGDHEGFRDIGVLREVMSQIDQDTKHVAILTANACRIPMSDSLALTF